MGRVSFNGLADLPTKADGVDSRRRLDRLVDSVSKVLGWPDWTPNWDVGS